MPLTERRRLRLSQALGDIHSFVLGDAVRKRFATLTIEELMREQLARNGDDNVQRGASFDPYSLIEEDAPASETVLAEKTFVSVGVSSFAPTRLDIIDALSNALDDAIELARETSVSTFDAEDVENT